MGGTETLKMALIELPLFEEVLKENALKVILVNTVCINQRGH